MGDVRVCIGWYRSEARWSRRWSSRSLSAGDLRLIVFVNHSTFNHHVHIRECGRDVKERIALHHDDVGQLSRLNRPKLVALPQNARTADMAEKQKQQKRHCDEFTAAEYLGLSVGTCEIGDFIGWDHSFASSEKASAMALPKDPQPIYLLYGSPAFAAGLFGIRIMSARMPLQRDFATLP